MAKSVVGLFHDMPAAQQVVQDLIAAGFDRGDISVLAANDANRHRDYLGGETTGETSHDALKGAGTGAAIGGGLGLVAGLASLAIPGFGPIIAAGPIASALAGAGIGAAAGGLIGALTHIGVPEDDAEYYVEGVRRGGILVTVRAEDRLAERAADIMENGGAEDVDHRSEEWRASGWQPKHTAAASSRTAEQAAGHVDANTRAADSRSRSEVRRPERDVRSGSEIPIVEEQVEVGKRQVNKRGVRLYTEVRERPVEETVNLRDEEVKVSRKAVDRPATDADMAAAFKETVIELTESSEEPVVSKTARVVEEVSVGKEVRTRQERVQATARKTEVHVQPTDGGVNDDR